MVDTADSTTRESEEASRAIFTLANVVSFVRLLMVPLYLFLLMNGQNFGTETDDIVKSILLSLASLAAVLFTKIHPIAVICAAGLIGYFIF